MSTADDSKTDRDRAERDTAVSDRLRAATDRVAAAQDRGRDQPDAVPTGPDTQVAAPVASVEYGRLVAADERDARADAEDRSADQRDARAAITAHLAGDEPNGDRGSAAVDRASAAGDRSFAAQDRHSAFRDHFVTPSEATESAARGRDLAANIRDQAASRRDRAADVRDESAAMLDDGDLEGVLGAVSGWADAEAELKAVARLRKFEDQYRLLAANSTNVVWELDREAVLRWVSPSMESVLGWTEMDLLNTTPLDLVHQIDQNALKQGLADAQSGRDTPQFESRILTAEGSYRWTSIQVQATLDPDDSVSGVIVGLRDVHSEVVARHQVARSERMFRLAMASAPQGMALVGLHLRFLEVNTVLCDMLGRAEEWFQTRTLTDVVHPDDLESDLAGRDELLSGAQEKLTYQHRWVKADGSTAWVTHSTGLVRDEEQMPLFYISHVQEINQSPPTPTVLGHTAEQTGE